IGIVALILGLVARHQARSAPGGARAMGTVGAVLGGLSLILGGGIIAVIVHFGQTNRSLTGLRTRECFDSVRGLIPHYRVHSGSSPHQLEAFGTLDDPAPSDAAWPGLSGFGPDE